MPINPLGAEDLERLNRVLESCAETREYLSKCAKCHLNVDQQIRDNEEQARIAAAIKAEFFPESA